MHSETNILDFIDYKALPYDLDDYDMPDMEFVATEPT